MPACATGGWRLPRLGGARPAPTSKLDRSGRCRRPGCATGSAAAWRTASSLLQRQADRLAGIGGDRLDADQSRDLVRSAGRLGQRHPLLDAARRAGRPGTSWAATVRGLVPVAGEGIGQRQVLAGARIGADRAGSRLEHRNRGLRVAGQRQRQAGVGRIEQTLRLGQQQLGLVILALGDLDQRQLQDDLRLVGVHASAHPDRRLPPKRSGQRRDSNCRAARGSRRPAGCARRRARRAESPRRHRWRPAPPAPWWPGRARPS